ncbi:uncharacterized protein EV422DRAFT_513975 [Fimicolochytrium jonesii]|uniref:uncharacterized protein n=1 Tax=Fimicolochytrium jonesii TaxID=1396493 RepID=UPI0022FEBAB9|nr:uncharacterized protein EV422DRAFT_513975 [Fimicolochytrium jonesii]KAI8825723.1 hypothetical protein EV422DRAFT_513975 [Fimicolochytrium jonesii]
MAQTCNRGIDDNMHGMGVRRFLRAFRANSSVRMSEYEQVIQNELMATSQRYQSQSGIFITAPDVPGEGEYYWGEAMGPRIVQDLAGYSQLLCQKVSRNNSIGQQCTALNVTHVLCMNGIYSSSGGILDKVVSFTPSPPAVAVPRSLARVQSQEYLGSSLSWQWKPSHYVEQGTNRISGRSCGSRQWLNDAPSGPPYPDNFDVAWGQIFEFQKLQDYLITLKPTENSLLVLIEPTGAIIASNKQGLLYTSDNLISATIHTTNNTMLKSAANAFLNGNSNFPMQHAQARVKDGRYNIRATLYHISDGMGFDVILFILIPDEDLISDLLQSEKAAIASVAAVSVVMLLVVIATSYSFTLPLKRLNGIMTAAIRFDFTALRSDSINRRSLFYELAVMEDTFENMLRRFSKAIQDNRTFRKRTAGPGVPETPQERRKRLKVEAEYLSHSENERVKEYTTASIANVCGTSAFGADQSYSAEDITSNDDSESHEYSVDVDDSQDT